MIAVDASRLQQLLEALSDPALLFDHERRLAASNALARTMFGLQHERYTPSQVFGTAQLADLVEAAADAGKPVQLRHDLDGRELESTAAPVGTGVVLVLRDQTARSRVDAIRRDFVANASHEMKTPVSGIQTLADALTVTLESGDTERSRQLSDRLADEAARLGRLITELLSLRRLEEGRSLDRAPVDLVTLVTEEVGAIRTRTDAHGIGVHCELPRTAVMIGSEADLRLVVSNLLDNAVGYNRDGGSIEVALSTSDGGWKLVVADSGIGIPRQDLDRIFERFYRVDIARSRAAGGTGLGLAIVRHAVEGHGGSVRADSLLGEGSTFTVELPVHPRSDPPPRSG